MRDGRVEASMSDPEAEEDPFPRSPLTAGLEKRALMEMRAVLTANTLRSFYSLLITAGHRGIVSTIDSDSVNLEDIPAVFDEVSDVAARALKKLLKLLEDAGKTLAPPESVPGANVEDRCRQVHRVICLFNRHLTESRARATELAIKLTADDNGDSDDDDANKSSRKKAKKKKKVAGRADSDSESESSSDSSGRRVHRRRTKAQTEQRAEAKETRDLHAVYETLRGFSHGTSMMSARVPHAKSRKAFSAALEGAKPSLPKLVDVAPCYESTDLPLGDIGTEHNLVVSLVHIRCILDHVALTHAVDLSSKFFGYIKPRACDRVDLEVSYARPGKADRKQVVSHVGVRPERLDQLEFALWAAVLEHRVTARALASMWARIYKRADQVMQQDSSTITHAIDTLLTEADLFRPVHEAGSGSGGGGASSSRSGGGRGPGRPSGDAAGRAVCNDFSNGRCGRGASCKFLHPSAMKPSGGAPRDGERGRRPERERERSRSRSASASRGRSPSRSPERGGTGRERGSAATPGGRRSEAKKVGFFA